MFQERIAKRDNLSAITITYLGRQEQISSYADIERLMTEAMTYDSPRPANVKVTAANSRVHALKAAIYNAYLRQTDDFRTSISN